MPHQRIQAALAHVQGHSVTILSIDDWSELVHNTGETTRLEVVPTPLSGIMSASSRVAAAGSGILNPTPGIDVIRRDPGDAPRIYNVYHYTVIENLPQHTMYPEVLRVAGVADSAEMRASLIENVYIVGPEKIEGVHHVEELPDHIREASGKAPHS